MSFHTFSIAPRLSKTFRFLSSICTGLCDSCENLPDLETEEENELRYSGFSSVICRVLKRIRKRSRRDVGISKVNT